MMKVQIPIDQMAGLHTKYTLNFNEKKQTSNQYGNWGGGNSIGWFVALGNVNRREKSATMSAKQQSKVLNFNKMHHKLCLTGHKWKSRGKKWQRKINFIKQEKNKSALLLLYVFFPI